MEKSDPFPCLSASIAPAILNHLNPLLSRVFFLSKLIKFLSSSTGKFSLIVWVISAVIEEFFPTN
ncbi:MAG: hypothetical protein DWQ58_20260 [Microcystis aeruginosa TA09]|nr:MAG: hypothetical protein DWQ58_20260 [Microcystis aeruginosa TA09]